MEPASNIPAAAGQDPERFQEGDTVNLGQWYWVKYDKGPEDDDDDDDNVPRKGQWFGCVMEIGSNYFLLQSVAGGKERIHVDVFFTRCKLEKDHRSVINGQVLQFKTAVEGHLGEIRELTARLGVAPTAETEQQGETRSLSTLNSTDADMKSYKKTLIKAKEKTLPDLFKKVEENNKRLAQWLSADILSVKGKLGNLKEYVEIVEERIFHVELYAGLTEEIELIQDGKPAELGERVRLLQGQLYMDEECLIDYDAGGMEFKNIRQFDKWLLRPHNLTTILPFQRCMVAFQVRRETKERERCSTIEEAFVQIHLEDADKRTFIYLRNGEKVYRLITAIDLHAKLFPDVSEFDFNEPLMADTSWAGRVKDIIPKRELEARIEKSKRNEEERQIKYTQWMEDNKGKHKARDMEFHNPHRHWRSDEFTGRDYTPFNRSNVHYDDIKASIEADMKYYNRVVLILQGLLDRSPVFHPHPPASLWKHDNFESLVHLVYDRDRALYAGAKPDFEVFRAQCNKLITVGSVVIGMQAVWRAREKAKYAKRTPLRYSRHDNPQYRYEPHPDPGPSYLMKVTNIKGDAVTVEYTKPRQRSVRPNRYSPVLDGMEAGDPMTATVTAKRSEIFNASAYTPGDYKMFFADPRTRAEYLQWAPFLLGAEDFRAGKRKVDEK